MGFTGTMATNFLNALVGQGEFTLKKRNVFLGISSTEPNTDGSNFTEPNRNYGYNRPRIHFQTETTSGNSTITKTTDKVFEDALYGYYAFMKNGDGSYQYQPDSDELIIDEDPNKQGFYLRNDNCLVMFDECHNYGSEEGSWGSDESPIQYFGLFVDQTPSTKPFFVGRLETPIVVKDGEVALFRKNELVIAHKHLEPVADTGENSVVAANAAMNIERTNA